MEATEFVEFMNLQMTPSWEIVQQREREQKLVVESGVKLQQAESTTESDSEEQFRLHHSPQTPQPRKHDRLGMQPQPQYPLAFTAPDEVSSMHDLQYSATGQSRWCVVMISV